LTSTHQKWEFIIGGLCQLSASVIQSIAPFVLRYLISFAVKAYVAQRSNAPAPNLGEGFGLVIAITVLQFFQSLATNHFMYRGMMIGGEARGVLIALIFNKAMKLSGRAKAGGKAHVTEAPPPGIKPGSEAHVKWYKKMLKKNRKEDKKAPTGTAGVAGDGEGWGNGRIVNLMSTDTYRVDQASGFFHMIWTAPIGILITTALLLINLTYSAVPGLGLILIAMPLLGKAVKVLFRRRVAIIFRLGDQLPGTDSKHPEKRDSCDPGPAHHPQSYFGHWNVDAGVRKHGQLHHLLASPQGSRSGTNLFFACTFQFDAYPAQFPPTCYWSGY
jgi:ATP-binding cassette subfamily C (CFTR/MRP) protein 1